MIQFKFVTQHEWISIHAINAKDDGNLYSFQVLSSEFQTPQSKHVDEYQKEVLAGLLRPLEKESTSKSKLMETEQ